MLRDDLKKRPDRQEGKENKIDFNWVMITGLQMGFSVNQIKHLRLGQWSDLFDSWAVIFNMKQEHKIFRLPEKEVSLSDI